MSDQGVLKSKEAVMAYLDVSDHLIVSLVGLGLPVFFVNGRWFSTTAAIDRWLTEFAIANRGKRFCAKNGQIEGSD